MIQNPYDRTTREGGASRPAHSLHCSSSTDSYPLLTGVQQQRYYFDHFHAAVLRCARRFGWDEEHFDAARKRMLADGDYWICTADGEVEFHYPRAERGDPHGEYDLGRMYYDGALTHLGRDRGLALMRSAAAKGYKHAAVFLDRLNGKPDAEGGD